MLLLFLLLLLLLPTLPIAHSLGDKSYTSSCKTRFFEQPKDHFGFVSNQPTYKQRVLYNLKHYKSGGPIFFYFGNEANVELYVEHTGLMWENAQRFHAAIVFAEHRGYGQSQLCDLQYFTTEQTLHDYAIVITQLKQEWKASAVIGFGGSYGGMLATAFRFHYPHLVDGVIAGSAPVLSYLGMTPKYDSNGFAQVVTRDAGPECAALVKKELVSLYKLRPDELRKRAKREFKLCEEEGRDDLFNREEFMGWITSSWDYMAMGNFPYPSSYVQPKGGMLPAYPVKAACDKMRAGMGLQAVVEMFYNATKDMACFKLNEQEVDTSLLRMAPKRTQQQQQPLQRNHALRRNNECKEGSWNYQYCTNHLMPFSSGTSKDMFYPPTGEFDAKEASRECELQFGVRPNVNWATYSYGGLQGLQRGISNIVFSNGLLDPWSAGGILSSDGFLHDSVRIVLIPNGAHHIDLMFSHPDDPIDVKQARMQELEEIAIWLGQSPLPIKRIDPDTAATTTTVHNMFAEMN